MNDQKVQEYREKRGKLLQAKSDRENAKQLGITPAQFRVLEVLAKYRQPMSYAEIAERNKQINLYSLPHVMRFGYPDSLAELGLIKQSLVDFKGRSVLVFVISPEGRELISGLED